MHKYTVEFRLSGKDLRPADVSSDLRMEPSLVRDTGEKRSSNSRWEQAMWAFDGCSGLPEREMWDSLEEGLSFVLKKLRPVRSKIKKYTSNYDAVWWCGHFQSSFDGGPVLSPAILKSLGEFGVELFIDNYFSSETKRETKRTTKRDRKKIPARGTRS